MLKLFFPKPVESPTNPRIFFLTHFAWRKAVPVLQLGKQIGSTRLLPDRSPVALSLPLPPPSLSHTHTYARTLPRSRYLFLSLHAPAIPRPSDARHPGSGEWQRHVLLGFEGLPQWEEYESYPEPCPPTAKYIRSWSEAEKTGSKSPKS